MVGVHHSKGSAIWLVLCERWIDALKGIQPGIGGTFSLSILPSQLAPRYSGSTASGFGLFFSLQAARHQM